ncbi:GerMN domain-containing protein [Arthrobacter sp. M4]|uniref:GerMN domain-containing protein n=1 Tax=Arthrobacter sp. M4 TaxID=218160 RepID=UPI001CDD78F3|nr:GerMN domain-containing protein [Arthrobacter sp. M4]MCA4131396.1 GerMN domain-containing protein [Arthrobacter sp. M4]
MLSGCVAQAGGSQNTSREPTPLSAAGVPSAPATNAPLETTQASNKVPVYWIGRSGENVYLYREFRDISGQENPVTTALRIMMSQKPLDRDFFTPWQEPDSLATSISGKNVITVDVSKGAFNSNLDAGMAQRAVQQLVYTATAAAASSGLIDTGQQLQVVILVDGHKDYMAFGQVKLGDPMSRNASLVAPVWIIDPQEDTSLPPGAVRFTGRSTVPNRPVRWQILRENANGDKVPVVNGQANPSAESGQGGAFNFTVGLTGGKYELRASLVSADGGSEVVTDTRLFVIK